MPKGPSRAGLFFLIVLATFIQLAPVSTLAQLRPIQEDEGITGFGLALRRLPTMGSLLYITAHPDDENNALIAWLSRGKGYRTGLLTLTRGDGGQNEIGPELFEALGVLRSEELASVHRLDQAQQYFSRAFEFGYSFSVEETLEKWDRQEILRDIVRVIRDFRPQVILTLNPTGAGGGQHHQASAQLAAEAFLLAGDPEQFPEQIEAGLRPWRPFRLFQSPGPGMGRRSEHGGTLRIDLGVYDPLLGETYAEFGARARALHRSQGMNVLSQPGPAAASYVLASSTVDSYRIENDFFDQIDVSLQSLSTMDPSLESSVILLDGYINWASEAFSRSDFPSAQKAVMTGLNLVRQMRASTNSDEARFLLEQKERDFQSAAEKGHFLFFDVLLSRARNGLVTPGETFRVEVRFLNRSDLGVSTETVDLLTPPEWQVEREDTPGPYIDFDVTVPETAPPSQPYWFRSDPRIDRFSVMDGFTGIEPYQPPPVQAQVSYKSFGVLASVTGPAQFRWFDADSGHERRMIVAVVPRLSVTVSPATCIVSRRAPGPCKLEVRVLNDSPQPITGRLQLSLPTGWRADPRSVEVNLTSEGQSVTRSFRVRPPTRLRSGQYRIGAQVKVGDQEFSRGYQAISYPHVQRRNLYHPAQTIVHVFDCALPKGLKVGYIMGVGDKVGLATEQLGAAVTYLTDEDLSSGDLGDFDVIVTGVRAYLNRTDLIQNNQRLLDYVRGGGHLVVQYNKYEFLRQQFTPYPVTINRPHDRITVEDSPVRVLQPNHALLNRPNRITEKDWDNWVQERGLYFLGEWDERFVPLLELQDPWPYNNSPKRGALLVAQYGKGTYIYTGLAFFRELPAGVPGAYRLWANLISLGKLRKQR